MEEVQRSVTISFRVSHLERAAFEKLAALEGRTLSETVRESLRQNAIRAGVGFTVETAYRQGEK